MHRKKEVVICTLGTAFICICDGLGAVVSLDNLELVLRTMNRFLRLPRKSTIKSALLLLQERTVESGIPFHPSYRCHYSRRRAVDVRSGRQQPTRPRRHGRLFQPGSSPRSGRCFQWSRCGELFDLRWPHGRRHRGRLCLDLGPQYLRSSRS